MFTLAHTPQPVPAMRRSQSHRIAEGVTDGSQHRRPRFPSRMLGTRQGRQPGPHAPPDTSQGPPLCSGIQRRPALGPPRRAVRPLPSPAARPRGLKSRPELGGFSSPRALAGGAGGERVGHNAAPQQPAPEPPVPGGAELPSRPPDPAAQPPPPPGGRAHSPC